MELCDFECMEKCTVSVLTWSNFSVLCSCFWCHDKHGPFMTCVCVCVGEERARERAVPLRKLLLILMTVTNAISNSLCTAQHTCKHDTHSTHSPTWMRVCVQLCVCVLGRSLLLQKVSDNTEDKSWSKTRRGETIRSWERARAASWSHRRWRGGEEKEEEEG